MTLFCTIVLLTGDTEGRGDPAVGVEHVVGNAAPDAVDRVADQVVGGHQQTARARRLIGRRMDGWLVDR